MVSTAVERICIMILSNKEADLHIHTYILQLVCSEVNHHAVMLSLVQLVVHWPCHLLECVTV